ncbi:MAG: tannase [Lachnospiraceae bacterium]|jgi:hypothetical protein|nr:tannase [Lachnospiraceae bacterium]
MKNKKLIALALTVSTLAMTGCGSSAASSAGASSAAASTAAAATAASAEASSAAASSSDAAAADAAAEAVSVTTLSSGEVKTGLSQVDMSKWNYNSDDDVYYQTGISYCETPADTAYETMGFFVPGAYFDATDNGDGTYTCTINKTAKAGSYTAETAPVVLPVNTPGYAAQAAPTDYSSEVADYCAAGFVYIWPGCRGRDAGAPSGVTDLKAAIRYTRYNEGLIPGDMQEIYSFGMSGGGAQSAVLGASGDSALYDDYLTAIGAVTGVSDAVEGAMCWCPITNLDEADEAYEWNMGVTRTDLSDSDQAISDGLAEAYAKYINALGIRDENGNVLTLGESSDGIYQAGSYYDYLVGVVETSLNNFLSDTTFPYTVQSGGGMMGRGMMGGGMPDGQKPDGAGMAMSGMPAGQAPDAAAGASSAAASAAGTADAQSAAAASGTSTADFAAIDNINRSSTGASAAVSLSGTYDTAQDYIDALNAPYTWVTYDASSNTAKITSMADFVKAMKVASKGLGAFDELDRGQGENTLFGYADGNGAHFDATLAGLVTGTDYEADFTADLAKQDAQGHTVDYRINMYTPLYYLCDSYAGYRTSNVAKNWRIRTGLDQGDTALSTEVNLALAAENYDSGNTVDFATVWGLGHTMAERTGDSTSNFITWVEDCVKG